MATYTLEGYAARWAIRGLGFMLLAAVAVYPLDWMVWRIERARGGGLDAVEVTQTVAAELNGGKEAYYGEGTTLVSCSRTLYPQGGFGPCWWLRRHSDAITRY